MATPTIKDLKPALIIFIDVLGFGNKVKNIQKDEDAAAIYEALMFIHDEFEKNITNEAMTKDHELEGKTVMAFSDSIIISLLFESDDSHTMGLFENMIAHLHTIALSQTTCVEKGLFLRGGIAKGGWFRDGDVMISDALVKAYEMESHKAKFPILAIDPQTYDYFSTHQSRQNSVPTSDPVNFLFNSTNNGKNTVHYLDYLNIGLGASEAWYSKSDRQEYLKAEPEQKMNVLDNSFKRSQLSFLKKHRQVILNALNESPNGRAKSKYRWLCRYHNSVVRKKGKDFQSSLIKYFYSYQWLSGLFRP